MQSMGGAQAGPERLFNMVRGIRGAITVERDEPLLLLDATERLLRAIVEQNAIDSEDVASALFTLTPDLVSEFPAAAARRMGWVRVPLLNFTEIAVPGGLARVIRVLIHVNTDKRQDEIVHVYLDGARILRPDLERS
jgi:chorismate mutase